MFSACFRKQTTEERIEALKNDISSWAKCIEDNDLEMFNTRKGYFQFSNLVRMKFNPLLTVETNKRLLKLKNKNIELQERIAVAFQHIEKLRPVKESDIIVEVMVEPVSTDIHNEGAPLLRRRVS